MKVLITGSAGFIGFHLAKALLERGDTVVGYDNFNDYYYPGLKRARVNILDSYSNYTMVTADLCDYQTLSGTFTEHQPELVVHLAAQAGVRYSIINPFAYQKSNLEGFLNVLELTKRNEIKTFLYASSSSVYGGICEVPYHEAMAATSPVSLYAATKRANELMAHTYSHLFNLQTLGLRFFTVYGPWGRPDMAYWLFIEKILNGEPINVFNHGNLKRDFTYIDDIIGGVVGLIDATGLPKCEVYNIGNSRSENLMDFIGVIEGALGQEAQKIMAPMQPGDVHETYADISKLQKAIGYRPTTPISVGIPAFAEWYLENPDLTIQVRDYRLER